MKQQLTLESISKLLDQKFKTNNEMLLLAFDRDVKNLEGKINTFEDNVNNRFDRVEDKIQSLDERLIVQSERVRKLEKSSFATS